MGARTEPLLDADTPGAEEGLRFSKCQTMIVPQHSRTQPDSRTQFFQGGLGFDSKPDFLRAGTYGPLTKDAHEVQ
jgi:hypothetical protein